MISYLSEAAAALERSFSERQCDGRGAIDEIVMVAVACDNDYLMTKDEPLIPLYF